MAPRIAKDPAAEQGQLPRQAKVLVVSEDPASAVYYHDILEGLGLRAVALTTYVAGLACLDRETFGLIVVSQGSRAFEGRCILERALQIDRQTPVLVVTRCRDTGSYLEAMHLGAVDYLEEPIAVADMVRVVEAHLRS